MFRTCPIERTVFGGGENRLICGDALRGAWAADYEGQARAVMCDPPFFTKASYELRRPFGEDGWRYGKPVCTAAAYDDRMTAEAYGDFLRALAEQAKRLLMPGGFFGLHLDWRASARARLICDEVFGERQFVNEIIWSYESGGRSQKHFPRKHDTILLYAASLPYRFALEKAPMRAPRRRKSHLKRGVDEHGRAYGSIRSGGREYRYYDDEPAFPTDVWTDISHLQQLDPERTGYPTQKPLSLLERLLRPIAEPGDLVVDLCCGSGTASAMASLLGCRFVAVDSSPSAVSVTQHRLRAENLTVEAPCEADETALSGTCADGVVTLSGFRSPRFPDCAPLDALESWTVGTLEDGTLRAQETFRRTPQNPALPQLAFLQPAAAPVGIVCVDALGRRHGFVWEEESN